MYKPVETGVGIIIIIIIIMKKRNWDMQIAWMEPRVLGLLLGYLTQRKRKKKKKSREWRKEVAFSDYIRSFSFPRTTR